MKSRIYAQEIKIPSDLETIWNFFTTPENLYVLTPPKMKMKPLNSASETIFEGQILRYKITPILFIPMIWETKITEIIPKISFTDIQTKGPYATWIHKHKFEQTENEVLMKDSVEYSLPISDISDILIGKYIENEVKKLFTYRNLKVQELWP